VSTAIAPPPGTGRWILRTAWGSSALLAIVAGPVMLGATSLDGAAEGVSLALFVISLVVWTWAFVLAFSRSANGEDIVVGSLFFLTGSAPKPVRDSLRWAMVVSVIVAGATAAKSPFSTLVPMLPIGLAGLWGARYGVFPARPKQTATRARRTGG
jgi:hypothetical protein